MDIASFQVPQKVRAIQQKISERHVQALWFEQRLFSLLQTKEGLPIKVISPGIWNTGAGPDFLKAQIQIAHQMYHGDIEIHIHDHDWRTHAHEHDSRYNQVILHVSLFETIDEQNLYKQNGAIMTACSLEPFLKIPIDKIPAFIDLELYPYEKHARKGDCAERFFQKCSDKTLRQFLNSAAQHRLKEKYRYLQSWVENPINYFVAGMAQALGYKHNAEAFLELFLTLMPYRDLPEEELLAQAMGRGGFFEKKFQDSWGQSQKFQELFSLWHLYSANVLTQIQIKIQQVRPQNHPVRRMVYLVKLLKNIELGSIQRTLYSQWEHFWQEHQSILGWKSFVAKLLDVIPIFYDHYWNSHFLFELKLKKRSINLLGGGLKKKMLYNAFFPLLYVDILERACEEELKAFEEMYQSIQIVGEAKALYLKQRFFSGGERSKGLLSSANIQQGMYQVHRDYCLHYEASCRACPFVECFSPGLDQKSFRKELFYHIGDRDSGL